MDSMEKGLHYCCVAKGSIILQSYNNNNHSNCGEELEIEKLASFCLEKIPQFHKWYSQTMNKKTYCYLMEDGFVYFAIAEVGFGNQALIRFLEHYRDEFKKITKRGSGLRLSWKGKRKGAMSNSNLNPNNLQEQLVPVIHKLINFLQNVGQSSNNNGNGNVNALNWSSSPCGGSYGEVAESASSTKALLLGVKPGKQEKRSKEHVIGMRGIEIEDQCKSLERGGLRDETGPNHTGEQNKVNVFRRSYSQNFRRKWWRLVQLVIAIDAVVCITLLIIWLVICKGIQCIR